jgi:2-polyprenyl-3-methyl-5-hydroxy-6-metoxy-1,4-benzoquinol methylase
MTIEPFGEECPACGNLSKSVEYKYEYHGRVSRIFKCYSCTGLFASPIPLPVADDRQMETVDDADLFNNSLLKGLHEKLIIEREIKHSRKLLDKEKFSVLDVGCGTGWTSSIWARHGADVTGLEPSPPRARIARERHGFTVIESHVEGLDTSLKFDVIIIRHVLEHLENPLQVITNLRPHLEENGLLLVIVPNIDCIGRIFFREHWTWVLPFHCHFFTPQSLRALLTRAGLKVAKSYQTPSPLWYSESFFRFTGMEGKIEAIYKRLSIAALLPFAPVVALGSITGKSDNITMFARK